MASNSSIEWTESTWNPIVGCFIVSPGCTNCYAMRMAARLQRMGMPHYASLTQNSKAGAVWSGEVAMAPAHILQAPLGLKKPKRIFVNSMGDLFHESIPDEWILRVLDIIRRTSWDGGSNCGKIIGSGEHTYQLLTKRAARMASFMPRLRFNPNAGLDEIGLYLTDDGRRPPIVMNNLWLGVSAERQQEWDERKEHLRATPAAVRFASFEPLLGPIIEPQPMSDFISWAITGGESGPNARPMCPAWATRLRDQCAAANVPFFHKQNGEFLVLNSDRELKKEHIFLARDWDYVRVGKKAAGRLLEGVEYNAMPGQK